MSAPVAPTTPPRESLGPPPNPPAPARETPARKADELPETPRKGEHDRAEVRLSVFWGLVVALVLAAVIVGLLYRQKVSPRVVLEARSHAVVFTPADTIDLVRFAFPRHGLDSGGIPFSGIRFARPHPPLAALDPEARAMPNGTIESIQRLVVTPGCDVRLEHYVDRLLRLDIALQVGQRDCWMSVALTAPGRGTTTLREPGDRRIELGQAATVIFQPRFPLRLRDIPVSGLRFETGDTGFVRSAIIGARLERPEVDDIGSDAHTAHVGDVVRLGKVDGTITELILGDTVTTLFKGIATAPYIEQNDLRPSRLEHLSHKSNVRLGLVVIVTVLTLVAAVYQAVLK